MPTQCRANATVAEPITSTQMNANFNGDHDMGLVTDCSSSVTSQFSPFKDFVPMQSQMRSQSKYCAERHEPTFSSVFSKDFSESPARQFSDEEYKVSDFVATSHGNLAGLGGSFLAGQVQLDELEKNRDRREPSPTNMYDRGSSPSLDADNESDGSSILNEIPCHRIVEDIINDDIAEKQANESTTDQNSTMSSPCNQQQQTMSFNCFQPNNQQLYQQQNQFMSQMNRMQQFQPYTSNFQMQHYGYEQQPSVYSPQQSIQVQQPQHAFKAWSPAKVAQQPFIYGYAQQEEPLQNESRSNFDGSKYSGSKQRRPHHCNQYLGARKELNIGIQRSYPFRLEVTYILTISWQEVYKYRVAGALIGENGSKLKQLLEPFNNPEGSSNPREPFVRLRVMGKGTGWKETGPKPQIKMTFTINTEDDIQRYLNCCKVFESQNLRDLSCFYGWTQDTSANKHNLDSMNPKKIYEVYCEERKNVDFPLTYPDIYYKREKEFGPYQKY